MPNTVTVHVNGAPLEVAAAASVAELLNQMGLAGQRCAVERNGDIVSRSDWSDTAVQPGDRYEIVRAIGGG